MIIQRKWKALLRTVVSLIIFIVIGWYFLLYIVSEAFGSKCENNRIWEIEEYQIIEKKCIGFSGSYFYPVYLYKDSEIIDKIIFIQDSSCLIKFKPEIGDLVTFDICEKKLK